jgi:amino acid transporter
MDSTVAVSETPAIPTIALEEKAGHRLDRRLALRDLVFSQVLNVVGMSWVGVAAGLGQAETVFWIGSILAFYLPMAVSVFFLNREMPLEGGLYVWARTAFGDSTGFMTAWNLWGYGIICTAAIISAVPRELAYLLGANWIIEDKPLSLAIVIGIVLLLSIAAYWGLGLGKWIHNIGSIAVLAVFVLLILLPFWALAHHVPLHYAPFTLKLPKGNLATLALIGQLLGALSGLEYLAILAGETKAPSRAIGRSVVYASPIICAMFIFGTASVLAFHQLHPEIGIDFVAPIPQTLRLALGAGGFGSLVGTVAILLIQLRLIGAASMLLTGVTRLPMTAGWDHLVPEWFARLHPRRHTPTNSILVTSAAIILLVLLSSFGVHATEAYEVLANASSELYALGYLAMFAIPLIGAKVLRERLPRWVAWTSTIGFTTTALCFFLMAYPFVSVEDPAAYAAKILGTTALMNLVGFMFYRSRNRTSKASRVEVAGVSSRH